nr:hypothetical protein [Clostridioides difficile]
MCIRDRYISTHPFSAIMASTPAESAVLIIAVSYTHLTLPTICSV